MSIAQSTRPRPRLRLGAALPLGSLLATALAGCGTTSLPFGGPPKAAQEVCEVASVRQEADRAEAFRRAETDRAEHLSKEIERLQADLRTAESALVEVESGLSGSHTRADAVSSLAVTRIQVERAATRAPWREVEIDGAREKLEEAKRQVSEGRFGAALFFVYRARRVAEGILEEADEVMRAGNARLIRAPRVNLRSGPSTTERVLKVLEKGTAVLPLTNEGQWTLVQVTGGPSGWIHGGLLGARIEEAAAAPASPRP